MHLCYNIVLLIVICSFQVYYHTKIPIVGMEINVTPIFLFGEALQNTQSSGRVHTSSLSQLIPLKFVYVKTIPSNILDFAVFLYEVDYFTPLETYNIS